VSLGAPFRLVLRGPVFKGRFVQPRQAVTEFVETYVAHHPVLVRASHPAQEPRRSVVNTQRGRITLMAKLDKLVQKRGRDHGASLPD
jgi:hypothetical protein